MDLVPLAGDVAMLVEVGGEPMLIPRPICEAFSLLVIDPGPSEPERLAGVLTVTIRLGPEYVQSSLALLNARLRGAGQPARALPAQLLCRVRVLLPAPPGSQSAGAEGVDVVLRPGERQSVQFRLGRDAVNTTLALLQATPTWTPQVNVSALLRDTVPLSVLTSSQAVEVRKQRVHNSLLVTLPSDVALDAADFVVLGPSGEERYRVPAGGVTIDTLPREPLDYYVEWAAADGVTNIVSGRLEGWSPGEVTYLKLPVSSLTVKITPAELDKVGASARLFLLVLEDSGGGLRLATFEDENRTADVLRRILGDSGTALTGGILIGFDEAGNLTGARKAKANTVVGFPTVFVSVLGESGDLAKLLTSAADERWRRLLGVVPGGDAEAAYQHYFPELLRSTFIGVDPAAPPAPAWLATWAGRHNRSTLDRIRASFPLLDAGAALGRAGDAAQASQALDAIRTALATQEPAAPEVARDVVASFLSRASALAGFGPAVIRASIGFPTALESISAPEILYAIGRILEGPGADALDALAFHLYSKAATSGSIEANMALGVLYEEGRGAPRDLAQAESLFRAAVALPRAKYRLGRLLIGKGDPFSIVEGMTQLTNAATAGSDEAMVALGLIHQRGEHGLPVDLQKAREQFTRAAAAGNLEAKLRLGVMDRDGLGAPVDNAAAAALLLDAARGGVAEAQFAYAGMLVTGTAASPDPALGPEHFFRLAAKQGHAPAMTQALFLGGIRLAETGVALAAPPASFQDVIALYASTFARLGKIGRASALAAALPDARIRWNALFEIADAAAKRGSFEEAKSIAEAIEDPETRDNVRTSIAMSYVDVRRQSEAASLIGLIGNQFLREGALVVLAGGYAKAGQVEEAKAAAARVSDPLQHKLALVAIAGGLASRGDFSGATLIVQGIDGGRWLVDVAWGQLKAGDKAGARLTAERISDAEERGRAFGGMARWLLDDGAIDEARDIALLGPPSSFSRMTALHAVVVAYAKHEELAKANALLAEIPPGQNRNATAGSLAILEAQAGHVDEGLALATAIPDDNPPFGIPGDDRPGALGVIAEIRLRSQGVRAALDVLNRINDLEARRVEVYRLADTRAEAGDVAGAGAILGGLPDQPGKQDGIHAMLAHASASAAQYQAAIDQLNLIVAPNARSEASVEVIFVMARAHELARSRELADTLQDSAGPDHDYRSRALSILASSLFGAGRVEEAFQTAMSIPSEDTRARSLSDLRESVLKVLTGAGIDKGIIQLGGVVPEISKGVLVDAAVTLAEQHLRDGSFSGALDNLDRGEAIATSMEKLVERVVNVRAVAEGHARLLGLVPAS
jgi:TPR repeat protein